VSSLFVRLVPERIGVLIICDRLVPERIGVLIICDRWCLRGLVSSLSATGGCLLR
jgi:hypothetical protein